MRTVLTTQDQSQSKWGQEYSYYTRSNKFGKRTVTTQDKNQMLGVRVKLEYMIKQKRSMITSTTQTTIYIDLIV